MIRAVSSSDDRVEIEHRQRLRMITGLNAVARQAQYVAHPHRGAAQDVALDRDAVLVAAGDLHDRRVADPREERADGDARHVAVGTAAVSGIDGIDITVEDTRAPVDLLGVRGVGWRHLRGHRELPRAQDALQTAGGCVTRQDRQWIAGYRLVLEDQALSPARSRATRNQEDLPVSRRSTGMLYVGERVGAAGNAGAAGYSEMPDALHVRPNLAVAVGAHAAAGSVAQVLRTVHGAGHAGRAEDALPAHPAIEQQPLDRALEPPPRDAPDADSRCA